MEYGEVFSKVYQKEWGNFSIKLAGCIMSHFKNEDIKNVLDLCCGTGHLCRELSGSGFEMTGIDISKYQIMRAKEENKKAKLKIKYSTGDAAHFKMNSKFDLIICAYDSINHLQNYEQLNGCIKSVRLSLKKGKPFLFDLNTEKALKETWDKSFYIYNKPDIFFVNTGNYSEKERRAFARIQGFIKIEGSKYYERFDEKIFNTAYEIAKVTKMIKAHGFSTIDLYSDMSLEKKINLKDAENANRVFFVVR